MDGILLLIWIGCFIASCVIGSRKGNPIGAAFLGALLGPIGLVIVALSSNKNRKRCHNCGEMIYIKARECPYCHK